MDNVVITNEQIKENTIFFEKFLKEYGSNIDVNVGSQAYDFYIRSMSILKSYFDELIETIKNSRDLDYIQNMEPGLLRDQMADTLLSSLFIDRKQGSPARGNIEIRIGTYENITIPQGTLFYNDPSYTFELDSEADLTIFRTNMRQGKENGIKYYAFEVPVKSSGNDPLYFLLKDQQLSTDWDYSDVISLYPKYDIDPASGIESTNDLIQRAKDFPSIAIPVNRRAIRRVLGEFDEVIYSTPIGADDPEMTRSRLTVSEGTVDVKNMTDIYVKGNLMLNKEIDVKIQQVEHNAELVYAVVLPKNYYVRVKDIKLSNGTRLAGEKYYKDKLCIKGTPIKDITNNSTLDYRLSRDVEMYYPLTSNDLITGGIGDPPSPDYTFTICYDTMEGLSKIQDYLSSTDERVLCYNPLIKMFMPVFVKGTIEVQRPLQLTYTEEEVSIKLREHINNLKVNTFTIHNLYEFFKETFSISYIKTPVTFTLNYITENFTVIEEEVKDEIYIDNSINNNVKYTSRLFTLIADETLVVKFL